MKITRLYISQDPQASSFSADNLHEGLNLFTGAVHFNSTSVAAFAAHLLYGKRLSGKELHGTTPYEKDIISGAGLRRSTEEHCLGHLDIVSRLGEFRLKRYTNVTNQDRLTISSLNENPVEENTILRLLHNMPSLVLNHLYAMDLTTLPSIDFLLSEAFATAYQEGKSSVQETESTVFQEHDFHTPAVDFESLARRRDSISQELEERLSDQRLYNTELDNQLRDLNQLRSEHHSDLQELQRELRAVGISIAEIETKLRYKNIEQVVEEELEAARPIHLNERLAELDQQIETWRRTLTELEEREISLKNRLSQTHPDDSNILLPLIDQTACLNVLERLVFDLDGEVARLAHSAGSEICVCTEAHPRLNPIVETLRIQIRAMWKLLDEQERANHCCELQHELEYIRRTEDELHHQIQHLLDRRQVLLRSGKTLHTRLRFSSRQPLSEESQSYHSKTHPSEENLCGAEELQAKLHDLNQRQAELKERISRVESRLQEVQMQWDKLQQERSQLLSDRTIESLQIELDEIHHQLQISTKTSQASLPKNSLPKTPPTSAWRASDYLVKLTDGRLIQLLLENHGRDAAVITNSGKQVAVKNLSDTDYQLTYLSLCFALISAQYHNGINLPLLLEEPFARLDQKSATILAGVIHDFTNSGPQVLLFTSDQHALGRYASLGIRSRQLTDLVHEEGDFKAWKEQASRPLNSHLEKNRTVRTTTSTVSKKTAPQSAEETFTLSPEVTLLHFGVLGEKISTQLARHHIETVNDLFEAKAKDLAVVLDLSEISSEIITQWQTHLGWICFFPEISLMDAQVLTGAGFYTPDDLTELSKKELAQRLEDFFQSDAGARYRSRQSRYDYDRIGRWVRHAREPRSYSSGRSRSWKQWSRNASRRRKSLNRGLGFRSQNREAGYSSSDSSERASSSKDGRRSQTSNETTRAEKTKQQSAREQSREKKNRSEKSSSRGTRTERSSSPDGVSSGGVRFYLSNKRPVVDAPSIGPKTASQLKNLDILMVEDLLAAESENLAQRLNRRNITAETIREWQHQARLVCCIPGIRGHDAQILVACGLTDVAQISQIQPEDLLAQVTPFCESKAGDRLLRSSKRPDLAEVTDWVHWASQGRTIETAYGEHAAE